MDRVVLTIAGEQYAPSRLLWVWLHLPAGGIQFRRAGQVQMGDRISFEVQRSTGLMPVEGVVEAVSPLAA